MNRGGGGLCNSVCSEFAVAMRILLENLIPTGIHNFGLVV